MAARRGEARRDAVLGQELVEAHEGIVDALRGLEVLEIPAEVGEVIGGFHLFLFGAMLQTEAGLRVGGQATALTAVRREMGAAKR
jgi:hypothetical protein